MKTIKAWLICSLIFCSACGTKQADLVSGAADPDLHAVLVKEVDYDEKGLPLFLKIITTRPVNPGERFTIALFQNNRPIRSFDMIIKRTHGDLTLPLKILYRWTGRGFKAGLYGGTGLSGFVLDSEELFNSDKDLTTAAGASFIVPVVVGTAGGFMQGLMKGVPSVWTESGKIVMRAQEEVVTYSHYEYNEVGQMIAVTMYDASSRKPLVHTDFFYEGDPNRKVPVLSIIKSHAENKVRVIGNENRETGSDQREDFDGYSHSKD